MSEGYPLRAAVAGVLLFAIGLAMAGGLYWTNQDERERLQGWRSAKGTVVELLKRRSIDGERLVPMIGFTTDAGQRITFTATTGARDVYYVASTVPVIYPVDHPDNAQIDYSGRRRTRNVLAGGAALILLALGGYVAWYASRWDRMAPQN